METNKQSLIEKIEELINKIENLNPDTYDNGKQDNQD